MKNSFVLKLVVVGGVCGLPFPAVGDSVGVGDPIDRTFFVTLDGAQEAPGPGDPDGSGEGTVRIYEVPAPGPGVGGPELAVDWSFTVDGIAFPLTGAHIHNAPAGTPGPVVVNFDAELEGNGLIDPDLAGVLDNPSDYYVNFHNADFPGGAIRGQLPEPSTIGLVLLGVLGVIRRR